MSVRLEWSTAETTGVSLLRSGQEAGDGQKVNRNALGLVIGSQVIEGTKEELVDLAARALTVLTQDLHRPTGPRAPRWIA